MSKITIVNENDKVIGSSERREAYKKGLIHRIVRILLINNEGKLPLQLRSKKEDTQPQTWDQSAGGHVDEGDDYETAAYRELEEELGVSDVKLKHVKTYYTGGKYDGLYFKRFNALFLAEYSRNDFKLQEGEVEKVEWFSFEELDNRIKEDPDSFTHGLRTILSDYRDLLQI